jgi:flagellar biosynthesis GTPase FlhF
MLHQILCLANSNPGAALAALAAAQAALHNSTAITQRLNSRRSEHVLTPAAGNEGTSSINSSASSALHQLQHHHCQQCSAAAAANEHQQQQKQTDYPSSNDMNSRREQQLSQAISATAATVNICQPHVQLQQQQQQQQRAFLCQPTPHSCRHMLQSCQQQQQHQQQGPAAFWLVGQAWRGLQHPNK